MLYFTSMERDSFASEIPMNREVHEKVAKGLYVSWEVMPTCDLACPHCYALNEEDHNFRRPAIDKMITQRPWRLTTDLIKQGLDNLAMVGVEYFNIEGGEPTLRKDVVEILAAAKQRGMKTTLSTHGMHLLSKSGELQPLAERMRGHLDTLAISLDAPTPETNNAIRQYHSKKPSDHFQKVIEFFKWYGEAWGDQQEHEPPLYKLKINMVVMQQNMEELPTIGNLLKQLLPKEAAIQLKLIQVHPRGKGRANAANLVVSDESFAQVVSEVKASCGDHVVVTSRAYEDGVYPFIVIGYNGEAVMPIGDQQDTMTVQGEKLNVLNSNFPHGLQRFVEEHPNFLGENRAINSYIPQ